VPKSVLEEGNCDGSRLIPGVSIVTLSGGRNAISRGSNLHFSIEIDDIRDRA
jgi:hypothetical protein